MTKAGRLILAVALALCVSLFVAACGDDDGAGPEGGDTTATQTESGNSGQRGTTDDGDAKQPSADGEEGKPGDKARSKQIDELLAMHPIFPTKRFMNFAARGNPDACSLLSDKGRRAMEQAHGAPCPEVIRNAAADRPEPGLVIAGEFVPVEGFSDLEYPTTIFVLERERGRVSIGAEKRPMVLSRYGRIWLIDSIPLADIGTVS